MSDFLPTSANSRLRQSGFSLIELMVAIMIALFIVIGLVSLYISMKTTFTSQDQLSQLHDSERLMVAMLTTTVESATYFPNPLTTTAAAALPATTTANSDGTTFLAGQGITGTGTYSDSSSDTVDIRYQTANGDGLMNCQGGSNASGASQIWINSFAVDASNELTCSVNGGTAVALVGNVASMKILYGVDTTNVGFADAYLDADTITSANLWPNVYTAQFTLTLINPLAAQAGATATLPNPWIQTIRLLNKS